MDLSIVIVNYKSSQKTSKCIESILESDLSEINYEIIIVDNNSDDDICSVIEEMVSNGREQEPRIKFIQSEENLGMGGGNNLGIRKSDGRFILVLNPDTIVRNNAIKILYDYASFDKDVGIVGPKLLNPDNTLQYSCFCFPKFFTPILRRTFLGNFFKKHIDKFLMKEFDHNNIREVDWILGSSLMIKRDVLEDIKILYRNFRSQKGDKVEYFDERFFMYFEDTDLCKRMKSNDYKVVYNPKALVVHDHVRGSAENKWFIAPFTNKLAREHIKSWIKYFIKHNLLNKII